MSSDKNNKNPFQGSLNLPQTDFSLRANALNKEPEILKRWDDEKLISSSYKKNEGKEKFILHDGPPYANGNIHLGHVLNKVLKDITAKFKRMSGFHVPVKPGWDCHGLPIELKVAKDNYKQISVINNPIERKLALKKACREYASGWVETQKEQFKELGILMDWNNPYITMDPQYESSILQAFSKFVEGGHIERKNKTVPWCSSCKTVLSSAEIEHKDRKDPSIYVLFNLDQNLSKELFPELLENNSELETNFLIWTTTPWTLPLNRAVVLNDGARYVLIKTDNNKAFIVAKKLAEKVCSKLDIDQNILLEFDSSIFKDKKVNHPFIKSFKVPILLDNSVLLNEGTACVHSAPGCGPEDYILGVKNALEIFSPLSEDGKYTQGILPTELEGVSIKDGQKWVLQKLEETGRLLHQSTITHSYPHCWRCHQGLMFRATEQWFCNLKNDNLVGRALKEIDKIKFYPDWGKTRLHSFVENRTEWCISRQRSWGVPIPAVICSDCEDAFLSPEYINKVAEFVAKEGVEFWDKTSVKDLVKLKILPKNFSCELCGNENLDNFEKETDILDVWFDSGVSSFAVLQKNKKELGFPADLYLEGSDQHRGWFQSSLLSSMVLNGKASTKTIVTHGFTVDKKGHKMSKSLGNVIAPEDVIKRYSRDVLRLIVSASDYQTDIAISETVFKNVLQSYKKIRNTCRFMLSNLYDFDIKKDAIDVKDLLRVDQYALNKLYELDKRVMTSYAEYNFAAVFHALNNFCATDMSALYLDVSKDRLYTEKQNGLLRRSAQTTIYYILDSLTHLMAPVLSFLSEEVSDFYQINKEDSIHLQNFVPALNIWEYLKDKSDTNFESVLRSRFRVINVKNTSFHVYMKGVWDILEQLRDIVLKAIEEKRKNDVLKHSLEAKVVLYIDPNSEEKKLLDSFTKCINKPEEDDRFFKDWFIVSQFECVLNSDGLDKTEAGWVNVKVEHATGDKCPRCWQWSETDHPEKLCKRCQGVLGK